MRPLLASTILLGLALGAEGAAPPASLRPSDQLDYLFLGSDRPVLIRLHVRIGDKPYHAPWVEFMDRLFAWFDKDKDGFLSSAEVARLPSSMSLLTQTMGGYGSDVTGVPFATMDANKDGKVTKEEFRDFYRNNGFPALRFNTDNVQATTAKQINDAVYKRLDKAGAGHLTADKVAGMYEKLRALDVNEDEMLDQGELDPDGNNRSSRPSAPVSYGRMVAIGSEPALLGIDPSQETALVQKLMVLYDRNKDGKLTRAEVGLAPALFSRLDANGDGFLDAAELRAYLTSEPDLVLRLQVGTPGTGKGILRRLGVNDVPAPLSPRLGVVNEKSLDAAMRKKVRRAGGDAIALEMGDTRISLQVTAATQGGGGRPFNNVRSTYLGEYDRLAGKKGFIERSDAKVKQSFLFRFQTVTQADKNDDGKLTRLELIDWLDFVATGQDASVTITANDLGRGVFPVLDADGDGRLSLREMKGAWARLKPFAKGGKVTQADLPRTLRIVVGQGNNNNFTPVAALTLTLSDSPRPGPRGSAPVWFRKMDRNNDGDVSRKEWLGTDEDFAKIDTDGDGLISVAEALAFEAKKRKKDQP